MVFTVHNRLIMSLFFLIILISGPVTVKAQDQGNNYEEISVYLAVQGIGGYDVTAIYKDEQIYIPISEMFKCLKINQKTSEYNDSISGFFLDENNRYVISQPTHSVFINNKLIILDKNELLNLETTSLALRLDEYGRLFGLDCKFNFSSLTVELKTSHELPVIKELRLEQMRKNINRLRGEITVDTTINRKYHVFRGGMADWAVYSTQVTGGTSETRALLSLGAEFLGGETNIEINYSTRNNFDKRQQQYHWRWANNETKLVKQITVGKIYSRSVSSIYSPLIGTIITNTPTTFRRSFGTYTMTDFTEPGWTVELYINNVVVDFTTADASGFYKFDIPLVYGSSTVMLKFYGPWGEERQKEQNINVPYNFLPKGEWQYNIAGAMIQDTSHGFFTRGETNFGINRHLTLGGGFEYLSTISSTPSIPFVTGSAQLFNNILLNGEYAYGVRTKALLSYSLPSSLSLDIDYTKYAHEQKAIRFNYLEERKVRLSVPLTIKKFKAYSRFSFAQNILKETNYSTVEATISTFINGMSANITGNANWLKNQDPYIYGNLGLGFRFFKTLTFRPQVQYDFSNNDLVFTKVELENYFSPKCNLSMIWENNIRNNINSIELTFRYDFSFAQTSLNTRISKDYITTGQSARGSFAFGSGNGRIIADKRPQVGRAGLTVIPYLDINNNNHRDVDELIVSGLNIRINGGRILPDSKDSIIRILDLEPFASYMLEFNDTQFDNIAWQIKDKTFSIMMDPNQFKLLEIPVKIMGEVNGMVYLKSGNYSRPQGRIQVNIFDENDTFIASALSESDGYFNYLGLAPGSYYAAVDTMQLSRLKSFALPNRFEFEIQASENGDIIDGIEFRISKNSADKQEDKVAEPIVIDKEIVKTNLPSGAVADETADRKFFIQAGAFKNKKNADRLFKDLTKITGEKWLIVTENDFYKVRLGYFDSKETADDYRTSLNTPEIEYYISEIPQIPAPEKLTGSDIALQDADADRDSGISASRKNESEPTPSMDCDSLGLQNGYFVQAGAFAIKSNAEKLTAKLIKQTGQNWFIACGKGLYKVRLGYFATKNEAKQLEKILAPTGIAYYVNKPKETIIKDQNVKVVEIAGQKPTIPVQDIQPDMEQKILVSPETVVPKTKTPTQVKETVPVVKNVLPIAENKEGKVENKPLDNKIIVPPTEEVKKTITLEKFFIQAGAFDTRAHAERLSNDLFKITLKRWFIAFDNGLYKVRLGYFTSREAANYVKGTLNTFEVPYFVDGVPAVVQPADLKNDSQTKGQKEKQELVPSTRPGDSIQMAPKPEDAKSGLQGKTSPAVKEETKNNRKDEVNQRPWKRNARVETPPNDQHNNALYSHKFFIQADAYTNKAVAEQLAAQLLELTRQEWFIVFEDQLYKVRLGYFESKDEARYMEGTLNTPEIHYYIDEIREEKSEF